MILPHSIRQCQDPLESVEKNTGTFFSTNPQTNPTAASGDDFKGSANK
jgi:hypothetical protein